MIRSNKVLIKFAPLLILLSGSNIFLIFKKAFFSFGENSAFSLIVAIIIPKLTKPKKERIKIKILPNDVLGYSSP